MRLFKSKICVVGVFAFLLASVPRTAWAQHELNSGDTAWMLTSSVLVLFMTIPGLSLFYAGLVRAKNVLSVMMQCFVITCMVTILWTLYAYGLAFGDGGGLNAVVGFGNVLLMNVGVDTVSGTIPESVYQMFQLTFAIITPALMVGAFAERLKFSAMLWFMAIWLTVVYAPIAHWVWGGRVAWCAGRAGLRRRNRRAYQRRCRCVGALYRPRSSPWLPRDPDGPQQPRADRGRRFDAVGGVVWLQCREPACGRRRCRDGHGGHPHRDRHGRDDVDGDRVDAAREAECARNRDRGRCRTRGDHASVGYRGADRSAGDRLRLGPLLLLRGEQLQTGHGI